jgi:isopenicillin-N N-acyltransferase like protein
MPDEVIARHLSRPATPAQRGREFGAARAGQVAHTLARYRELFQAAHGLAPAQIRELGGRVEAALRGPWPALAQEIDGIADGAGVDAAELFAANARTEILSGASAPECSVIGVLPGRSATGSVLLAQNWDWHPSLAPSRVLWTIAGPDGRWLTTLTEAGILAKIGLNSAGLGVTLNILYCSLDGGVGGLPVHLLLRLLLAECDDMAAARALTGQAVMTASSCITVGWQPPPGNPGPAQLVAAELSPGGPQFVAPRDGLLLHTNHFCPAPPAGEDRFARDYPDTLARLADLGEQAGSGLVSAELIQAALRSHAGAPLSVCCHGEEAELLTDQAATLASVILDLGRRELTLAAGQPCAVPYELAGVPAAAGS